MIQLVFNWLFGEKHRGVEWYYGGKEVRPFFFLNINFMYFDMVTYKIPIDIRLKTPRRNPIGHDTQCPSVYSHCVCDRRWKSHTTLKNCRLSIRLLYPPPSRLSSSSVCDDFTEPRNLKLSPGLQPASEKPINSSFKPFVPLGSAVCEMCTHAEPWQRDVWASSLSVWCSVSDFRHSLVVWILGRL